MNTIIILILIAAVVSLFFNAGYIIHELGWYPHTKDRKSPMIMKSGKKIFSK